MADPTKYSRGYSFSNFQANTPNRPLPAPSLDTELDNVADSLGATIDALKDIRRSDGKLKAGSIDAASLTTDLVDEIVDDALTEAAASAAAAAISEDAAAASALAADVSADAAAASQATASVAAATSVANAALLGVWRGPWVTATAYAAGDRVSNAGNTYYATTAHTSAALFSTDLAALRWGIVAEKGASGAGTGDMLAAQNLNDVANKATARANLGVPETSTVLLKADNLSGLANAATARSNLGVTSLLDAKAPAAALHTVWLPAGSFTPTITNGAGYGSQELPTNDVMIFGYDFSASVVQKIQTMIAMPKSWDRGTITAIPFWKDATTPGTGDTIWGVQGLAIGDDDALDAAFGTAQTVTDTFIAAGDLHIAPTTSAITIAGSPAEGDLVLIQVYRDAAAGGDTYTQLARFIGLKLLYTTTVGTDA